MNEQDRRLFIEIADKADHDDEIMSGYHFTWEVEQITKYREAAERAAYRRGQREMQERASEWLSDRFSEAVQADCEQGVRFLNEMAAANYLKDAPDTLSAIREAPDAILALPIKETPDA